LACASNFGIKETKHKYPLVGGRKQLATIPIRPTVACLTATSADPNYFILLTVRCSVIIDGHISCWPSGPSFVVYSAMQSNE